MHLTDLLSLPEVEPVDLAATNGGVRSNIDLRTKSEIAQQRAFDDAFQRIHDYQVWPLESIGAGHDLGQHYADMASNRTGGGVINANIRPKRLRGWRMAVRWMFG